jgi:hypothetical protein
MRDNKDIVIEIARNYITKSDIVALAYRKKQLEIFEGLLHDDKFFSKMRDEWRKSGDEAVWQQFFENNTWIFGYGLRYIFSSHLDKKKLEQTISGSSSHGSGKRVDALLKTLGAISSLCFVELKTHRTSLLEENSYRKECWNISKDLAGAISQIQKTVQKAVREIKDKWCAVEDDGSPTPEFAFLFYPKAFVVIGNLHQFITEYGVNEQKFGSFEIFRRNLVSPEVITFDELYERARNIVRYSEQENNNLIL